MLLGGGLNVVPATVFPTIMIRKLFMNIQINSIPFLSKVYRTDLITAMKIPDQQLLTPGTYFDLSDPWKQEWERGVQVVLCSKYITFYVLFILALR